MPLTFDEAETIALQAAAFIAADEEALCGLLRLTGLTLPDLKASLEQLEILSGILQFLLQNEARLIKFCHSAGLDPTAPALALDTIEHHLS